MFGNKKMNANLAPKVIFRISEINLKTDVYFVFLCGVEKCPHIYFLRKYRKLS